MGAQYVDAYPHPLDLEDANALKVESANWEYAYKCFSEALLLERDDAELIGLFVISVLRTHRWSEYGIITLIHMLNRAMELESEDSDLLYTRAALFDAIGEPAHAAADRERIQKMRRAEWQLYAERMRKAALNQPRRTTEEIQQDFSSGF